MRLFITMVGTGLLILFVACRVQVNILQIMVFVAVACSMLQEERVTFGVFLGFINIDYFWGRTFSTNHITENIVCSTTPKILDYFSRMTQHFFGL